MHRASCVKEGTFPWMVHVCCSQSQRDAMTRFGVEARGNLVDGLGVLGVSNSVAGAFLCS